MSLVPTTPFARVQVGTPSNVLTSAANLFVRSIETKTLGTAGGLSQSIAVVAANELRPIVDVTVAVTGGEFTADATLTVQSANHYVGDLVTVQFTATDIPVGRSLFIKESVGGTTIATLTRATSSGYLSAVLNPSNVWVVSDSVGASTFDTLHITGTTTSTSTSTGSLINDGGFGNAGTAWFGGLVSGTGALNGFSARNRNTGSANDFTFYADADIGRIYHGASDRLTISSTGRMAFTPSNTSLTAWGATAALFQFNSASITDSSTAASGTATQAAFTTFAAPSLAATNASVTTTDSSTVFIAGRPNAGTNQTITNAWALRASGPALFDLQSTPQIVLGSGSVAERYSFLYNLNAAGGFELSINRNPVTGVFVNTLLPHATMTLSMASADSNIQFRTASANNTLGTLAAKINKSQGLEVYGTTASTTSATGSLINSGGFGNAGAAYIGGLLDVAGQTLALRHSSTNPLFRFYESTSTATASLQTSAGDLYISIDQNTANSIIFRRNSGTEMVRFAGSTGIVTIAASTVATSTTTGSLVNTGGFGNAGKGYFGNQVTVTDSTASSAIQVDQAVVSMTGTSQYGVLSQPTFSSAATSAISSIYGQPRTAASAYTVTTAAAIRAADGIKGSGSTITNQYGVYVEALTVGTNNYAYFSAGAGLVKFSDTTEATTGAAGSIVTLGGIYSTKKIITGSTLTTLAGVTWDLGAAAVVSPTSPNRTIAVIVGGTTYYIAAKTTND